MALTAVFVAGVSVTLPSQSRDGGSAGREAGAVQREARLGGMVMATDTKQPVRRARVSCRSRSGIEVKVVSTGADGRFTCGALTPGRYFIEVQRTGFVSGAFGSSLISARPAPIDLSAGETVDDVVISMSRAGVITGRITDELGNALSDVEVTALSSSRGRLVPVGRSDTDDQGTYRIWGVRPGTYYISSRALAGRQPAAGTLPNHAFYPGVTSLSRAQAVTVSAGAETSAGFTVSPVVVGQLSGTVTNSKGRRLAGVEGALTVQDEATGSTRHLENFTTDGEGRFRAFPLFPGTYRASVFVGSASSPEHGAVDIVLEGGNPEIRIVTAPVSRISGTVVSMSGALPATNGLLRVAALGASGESMNSQAAAELGHLGVADVGSGGSFNIPVAPGSVRFRVLGLPDGWIVGSVSVGNTDVTDQDIDILPQRVLRSVRIAVSNELGNVAGRVERQGRSVPGAWVLVFRTAPAKRPRKALPIAIERCNQRGEFIVTGLPFGTYLLVSVDDLPQDGVPDPAILDRVGRAGVAVSIDGPRVDPITISISPF